MLTVLLEAAEELARDRGDPQVEAAHLVLAWAGQVPAADASSGPPPVLVERAQHLLGPARSGPPAGASVGGAGASTERSADAVRLAIDVEELVRWVGAPPGGDTGPGHERVRAARLEDGLAALMGVPARGDRSPGPDAASDLPPQLSRELPPPTPLPRPLAPELPPDLPLEVHAQVEILPAGRVAVGMQAALDRAVEILTKREPGTPCFVGPPGSGRTTALAALATQLARRPELPGAALDGGLRSASIVRIRAAVVLGAGGGHALREIRDRLGGTHPLALDDLEVLLLLGASTTDHDLRATVRSVLARPDLPTIATLDRSFRRRLVETEPQLAAGLTFVELPSLDAEDQELVGRQQIPGLQTHHAVRIPVQVVSIAARPPGPDDRRAHPGLLVQRLDRACVRARARGGTEVTVEDVSVETARPGWSAVDPGELTSRLADRIVGQDEVLRHIASRLALTSVDLDLRPQRPNGVFLLAGPTGVGKTAIAQALASCLFGDEGRMIRLDLSEYGERHTVSRLTGPPPGYIGSDEPEGWLTTRVAACPVSVVLLDEIEKAHPSVWNVFLQVFDDGRLTDARGNEVSFSETVVIATSNLGARAFSEHPVGFSSGSGDEPADAPAAVRRAIETALPPELVNRFDGILVCRPLDEGAIASIARLQLTAALGQLEERGWRVELTPAAVAFVARAGYDPVYGARHLQRNVEKHLLEGVVGMTPGGYEVDADPAGDGLIWRGVR